MDEYVEIEGVTLVRQTAKAGHFEIEGDMYWVPWSQIDYGSPEKNGDHGTLYVTRWWAEKEGLA